MKILIVNGPNLNLLGQREPDIYGRQSFEEYLEKLRPAFPQTEIAYFQSNSEGELISQLHAAETQYDAIILNGAAYTHTSVALADAVAAIRLPVVEVHISNVFARETYRHHSYLAPHCAGSIVGLGLKGYELAVRYLLQAR